MLQTPVSWLPYALGLAIGVCEAPLFLRRRAPGQGADRGSFWVITALTGAGYFAAFFLYNVHGSAPWIDSLHWLDLGAWASWVGVALAIGGTAFRGWAKWTLGRYFTATVQVANDQRVVDRGPYRLIRHPSYTGGGVAALGIALSMHNALEAALIMIPMTIAFGYRIHVEERALAEGLGEPYRAYQRRTWRLVPYLF